MALDVQSSDVEEVGVISEQTETLVAPLAEQLPDPAGRMIVIEVLGLRVTTDAAPVLLCLPQAAQLTLSELVLAVEVAG
jgi:hypothetical protein